MGKPISQLTSLFALNVVEVSRFAFCITDRIKEEEIKGVTIVVDDVKSPTF